MRCCVAVFVWVAVATPAAAQSTYVGASLIGEFARFGHVDVDGDDLGRILPNLDASRNGETLGFDLRLGRGLGERWGVELAFARGGTIEQRRTQRVALRLIDVPVGILPIVPVPNFEFELRTEQQYTTVDALAWVRQDLGTRVGLALLGGVSFTRVESEQELRFSEIRVAALLPYPPDIETVQHGVGPVVGAEAVIGIAEHTAVTAGLRLHGVSVGGLGGWLVRPAAGLRWTF